MNGPPSGSAGSANTVGKQWKGIGRSESASIQLE